MGISGFCFYDDKIVKNFENVTQIVQLTTIVAEQYFNINRETSKLIALDLRYITKEEIIERQFLLSFIDYLRELDEYLRFMVDNFEDDLIDKRPKLIELVKEFFDSYDDVKTYKMTKKEGIFKSYNLSIYL